MAMLQENNTFSPVAASSPLTPTDTSRAQPTPSVISSRMTEFISEDGEEYHEGNAAAATNQSKVRASASSQREIDNRLPPSRSGALSFGSARSWRSQNTFGGSGLNISNTSRPQSATSRTSRTHIPSVTSHAFFHPMSSQRLQAQRGKRVLSKEQSAGANGSRINSVPDDSRPSGPPNSAVQIGPQVHDLPPPSRGTEFTEVETLDRTSINASPTGNATVQSIGESTKPLNQPSLHPEPAQLDLSQNFKQGHEGALKAQKLPKSFASNLLSSAKGTSPPRDAAQRHQRLSSDASSPRLAHAKEPSQHTSSATGSNWEYFLGNTVFFLGGRIQNTRDRPINIATGTLVVLPSILFFVYSAPYLWHNVSPAIPIVYAYIFFICISSFIHASVTDSGILPRNLHPFPSITNGSDPLDLGPPMTDWTMIKSAGSEHNAMDVPTKYCKTCNIWRPPRAHHCRVCNSCIETQDHHCVWLNNCVGRRNYRYFFSFISSGTILGLFLTFGSLGHCLHYRSTQDITFHDAIDGWRVPFAMFIYGLLITPYPASLLSYHLFLTGQGETTREYLNSHQFPRKDRHRPFTQGNFLRNWIVILTRPRSPTYLRFKAEYEEGDQRFGPRKASRNQRVSQQQHGVMELQNVSGPAPSFQGPIARAGGDQGKT